MVSARRLSSAEIAASFEELLALRVPMIFPCAHHPHASDAAGAAQLPLPLSRRTHGRQSMLNAKTARCCLRSCPASTAATIPRTLNISMPRCYSRTCGSASFARGRARETGSTLGQPLTLALGRSRRLFCEMAPARWQHAPDASTLRQLRPGQSRIAFQTSIWRANPLPCHATRWTAGEIFLESSFLTIGNGISPGVSL